jgi:hypothetical protein
MRYPIHIRPDQDGLHVLHSLSILLDFPSRKKERQFFGTFQMLMIWHVEFSDDNTWSPHLSRLNIGSDCSRCRFAAFAGLAFDRELALSRFQRVTRRRFKRELLRSANADLDGTFFE